MRKLLLILPMFVSLNIYAQNKPDFFLNADVVSSYIWRGSYQAGTSVQPSMGLEIGGFSICAWGSTDFARSSFKEIDLLLDFSLGDFSIGLYDNWFSAEESFDYFDFSKSTTHMLEASITYSLPVVPLYFSWNTFILGDDKYLDDNGEEKQAFSTYVEAGYDFSIKTIDLNLLVGASLWNSEVQYTYDYPHATDKFAIVNVGLGARKKLEITEKYSLDIFGQLIFNPAKEDAFLVFGISF